ncbi:acyl-CoA thioesterase [Aestuariibacter salexigens]|uniref:acyl-CoA thioesterase n=1 Tax=Aestuariibacter salexigens TaxID=226010 RepID=UPI0004164C92|nr:thioesterase family protein [Aestuariibacter salexigens]
MSSSHAHFTHLLRVRYGECDPQNVVFNARYADYADIAATEFMRAIWGDYASLVAQGIENQVVNLNISWKSSAKFDDVIAISVNASRVGNTSFSLALHMKEINSGRNIAEAEVVYVMVDATHFNKMPIPEHLKDALEMGAPGTVINHAGL